MWEYTNRSGALQVWNNTWSILNSNNVTLTKLQFSLLNTAYQWFSYENIFDGEQAFLVSMLNLTEMFPSELDAKVLLSLSYLNVAMQQSIELQTRVPPALLIARKILQAAYILEPLNPGILHYLIHAFDVASVEDALQGIPYAYRYGEVVRTASHGQHMPVHIWTRLG